MKRIRRIKIKTKKNVNHQRKSFTKGINKIFKENYKKTKGNINYKINYRRNFNGLKSKNKTSKHFNYKRKRHFKEKTKGNFKVRKIIYVKDKYRRQIKNKTIKEKFNPFRTYRKYHTKTLNWRAKRKLKKSLKFAKKSTRKRYKYYNIYRKGGMIFYSQLNRTFKNVDEDNAGIKSTEKIVDARLARHTRKYFKNKRKPKKFLKKSNKLAKKEAKIKKKAAFKKDLQKLSRKKKYKDSKLTSKFLQRRKIKRSYHYTIDKRAEKVLKTIWSFIKSIPKRIFSFIKRHFIFLLKMLFSAFIFIVVFTTIMSVFIFFSNITKTVVTSTTYLSDIEVLKDIEKSYRKREEKLIDEILNPQRYYKNYDIYEVDADDVGHDVHDLLSYITAKFLEVEDVSDVERDLEELFETNYTKSFTKEVVMRDININGELSKKRLKKLTIHIRKKSLKEIAKKNFKRDKEKFDHFEMLLETKGNMEDELKEFETAPIYGDRKIYKPAVGYQPSMEKYINSPLVIPGSIRQAVLMWAATHEGIPYRLGAGHGVPFGAYEGELDCSSFVCNAWGLCGGNIDRVYATFHMPNKYVKSISQSQLKPGDAILNQQHHIEMFLGFEGGYRTTGSHMEGVPSGMSFWGQGITHFITLTNLDEPANPELLKQLEEEIKKYDPNFERRKE